MLIAWMCASIATAYIVGLIGVFVVLTSPRA